MERKSFRFLLFLIASVTLLVTVLITRPSSHFFSSSSVDEAAGLIRRNLGNSNMTIAGIEGSPQWGTKFSRNIVSTFPPMDCKFHRRPICCSALESTNPISTTPLKPKYENCVPKKEYFPSPYEIRHLQKAEELAKIVDFKERTQKFLEFIESAEELDHVKKWLERIKTRQHSYNIVENDVDREYLSRFRVTQKCQNGPGTSWWEYIEPLTVHARHPLGFSHCRNPLYETKRFVYNRKIGYVSYLSVDYLLLQSHHDLNGYSPPHFYLLDAGTSRFDSSLYWFVCAYQQVSCLISSSSHPHLS